MNNTKTNEEIIRLLLTPISELSKDEVSFFVGNRELLRTLRNSPEYYRGLAADLRTRHATPNGMRLTGLTEHVTHASGKRKTVCTSAALAFFNVPPSAYHYSGHAEQDNAVLRRHGWSARSRKSAFGVKGGKASLASVIRGIKARGEEGHYKLSIRLTKGQGYHCIVIDSKGKIVVDTASSATTPRATVRDIYIIQPAYAK